MLQIDDPKARLSTFLPAHIAFLHDSIIIWFCEMPIPQRSNIPPFLTNPFCISTTTSAVLSVYSSIGSWFACKIIFMRFIANPPELA
jgi:hypothetical protein